MKVETREYPLRHAQPEAAAGERDFDGAPLQESGKPAAMPQTDEPRCQEQGDCPDAESGGAGQADVIRVRFNKRERVYSAEQAAPLVEMGLKWESFRPQYEKLKFLASIRQKTVGQLIDGLIEEQDGRLYRRMVEEAGGDEEKAAREFEKQKAERQKRFEQFCRKEEEEERLLQAERQSKAEQRLADEFLKLTEEFPGCFNSFSDLPRAVVECAVLQDIPLFDAYLRYRHSEAKRAAAERERQQKSAGRSAGSLSDTGLSPDFELDEFERAFYKALQ